MICYDYIISKKHNELLDNEFILKFKQLNNNDGRNKHNNLITINVENTINLELNNLNNNNINIIYKNINKYLKNNENNKVFFNLVINNSIIQHNNIDNYILLYKKFYEYNKNYNNYIIDYCYKIISNIKEDNYNYKDKYIGTYIFISKLFSNNIINITEYNKFFSKIFIDTTEYIYELNLITYVKITNIVINILDKDLINKYKDRILYLSKNLENRRLRFLCMDILDIINCK